MSHRTNRREFLGTSALAGAGAWVAGRYAFSRDVSPNGTVHLASIGTGGRGRGDLDETASQKGVKVVALCDVDEGKLNEAGEKYPNARKYTDYRKMFDEMHKDIDAVTVGTPDHHHAPASVMAMRRGKHVYCEKPLTHSIHEARVMAKLAAEKNLVTVMGNQGHAGQGIRRIVELVQAGAIGPIREAHAWTNRPIWPQGQDRPPEKPVPPKLHWDQWLGPAPQRYYHDSLHPFAWRGWWDFGTGALGDMACHIMDGIFWALKLGHATSVEAEGGPRKPESAPNWETIRLEFPARGDMPAVKVVWYDGKVQTKGQEAPNRPPDELFEGEKISSGGSLFVGEKGKIYVPHDYCGAHELLPRKQFEGFQPPPESIPPAPGNDPHAEFIDAILNGKKCGSNFTDYAGPMTEGILLGVVAFRVGRKLQWDGPAMKAKNCPEAEPFLKRPYRKGWTL